MSAMPTVTKSVTADTNVIDQPTSDECGFGQKEDASRTLLLGVFGHNGHRRSWIQ